ncbi:MAG: hypothetical protein ACI90V_014143, partial [Bacillariaceae sp.]
QLQLQHQQPQQQFPVGNGGNGIISNNGSTVAAVQARNGNLPLVRLLN